MLIPKIIVANHHDHDHGHLGMAMIIGEGRLTAPNLNPSGLPAAYHRPPYGVSMYVMSFLTKK